jgi:hypothetical protein
MKQIIYLFLLLLAPLLLNAQNLEVDGEAKVLNMNKDNSADSLVVRFPDGTLGLRDATSITDGAWDYANGTGLSGEINRSGNVGIGVINPSVRLHVSSNSNDGDIQIEDSFPFLIINRNSSNGNMGINFRDNGATKGWWLWRSADSAFVFSNTNSGSASNQLVLLRNGNVGIGTSIPTDALDVPGGAEIGGAFIQNGDFRSSAANGVINCGGANNTNANVISDLANPTLTFATGDEDLFIDDKLEVDQGYKTGGGNWLSVSDRRLKKNILVFEDGLDEVMQINPVTFQYNERSRVEDTDKSYVGVIAQELQDIAPYMIEEMALWQKIEEDENGKERIIHPGEKFLTYDGSALQYMLVNAVKEQQMEIQDLKQRVKELEKLIQVLLKN